MYTEIRLIILQCTINAVPEVGGVGGDHGIGWGL